jgi:hypothetical protein
MRNVVKLLLRPVSVLSLGLSTMGMMVRGGVFLSRSYHSGGDRLREIVRYAKRPARWSVVAFMGACVVLALAAVPALAERSRLSTITEANGGPFGGLTANAGGIVVDGSDNLWVGDPGAEVVDKFSSSGAFLAQSAGTPWGGLVPGPVAFSNASEHLFVTDFRTSDVWGLEPTGAYAGIDLTGPWDPGCCVRGGSIAADNSTVSGAGGGDLYLTGEGTSAFRIGTIVYRIDGAGAEQAFEATSEPYVSGNQLTGFALGESFSSLVGVAVDAAGHVYVADAGRDAVYEFQPSGKFLRSFTEANGSPFGSVSAVAVDPSNGHVLIADGANALLDEFSSTGSYLDDVVEVGEAIGGPVSLAVDSTGKLYVTEGNQVAVYGTYGPHAPRLPKLINGAVSGIGLTSATLNATVKPNSEEISECRFEYGTSEAFGQSAPCSPATFSSTTAVTGQLSGLHPDSFYLYRLHVVDPGTGPAGVSGPVEGFRTSSPDPVPAGPPASGCPNEAARQGLSASLPDCRAYEQVTPVDKGVAEDMFTAEGGYPEVKSFGFPSEAGNQFLLATNAAIGANAAAGSNGYVFSRAADGWAMASLAAPGLGAQALSQNDRVFSPADLSQVAFQDQLGTITAQKHGEAGDAMVVERPGGPYESIAVPGQTSEVVGAASDLGHVIIQSTSHEPPLGAASQAPGSHALYDWSGGHVSLVNVQSDGTTLVSPCGAILGQEGEAGGAPNGGEAHGAVSSDGSKVFFTAPDPLGPEGEPGCWVPASPDVNPPELYMRVNGSTTVPISVAEPGVKDATPYAAVYVGASADGSRVFFLSRGELTADDPGHAVELYEYNTLTSTLTRVSKGDSGNAVGDVGFVAAVSGDGSTVYFEASGRLAPGAPAGGLYHYDTYTRQTTYITTGSGYPEVYTNSERNRNWTVRAGIPGLGAALQGPGPNDRANWYATADGRYLVFPSRQPITGYDSGGHVELYRYSAADDSVVCVSCGSLPPVDNALFARAGYSVGPQSLSPRPISEDGSRVVFDTASALVPGTSAGQVHVYEWHEGVISLLSPPHDPHGSYFLGASADGANVFIGTHAQLVAQDTDNAGDLYDARIGGGFPEAAALACTGGGCQGVPPAPPIFATPSSSTIGGVDDLEPPPKKTVTKTTTKCRKGFTKNWKRKCVRKPKSKKKNTRAKRASIHRGVSR